MARKQRRTTSIDAEARAYSEYARRELQAMIDRTDERIARRRAAERRRKARLRRWSFGLLGR